MEQALELEKEVSRLNRETEELLRGLERALRGLSRDLEALEGRAGRKRYTLALDFTLEEGLEVVAVVEDGSDRSLFPNQLEGEEPRLLEPLFAEAAERVRRFRLGLEEGKAKLLRLLEGW